MHTIIPVQNESHGTSKTIFSMIHTRISVDEQITDTYGIEVLSPESAPILQYPDISTDEKNVSRLIQLMNQLEADPIHTECIIEDFLVDRKV